MQEQVSQSDPQSNAAVDQLIEGLQACLTTAQARFKLKYGAYYTESLDAAQDITQIISVDPEIAAARDRLVKQI